MAHAETLAAQAVKGQGGFKQRRRWWRRRTPFEAAAVDDVDQRAVVLVASGRARVPSRPVAPTCDRCGLLIATASSGCVRVEIGICEKWLARGAPPSRARQDRSTSMAPPADGSLPQPQPPPQQRQQIKKFETSSGETAAALASATVGLVTKQEFTRRREQLEAEAAAQQEKLDGTAEGTSDKAAGAKSGKKKKKAKPTTGSALSFLEEIEGEADGDDEPVSASKKPKVKKNPSVDSSFLPDKERDEAEARRREELAQEWEAAQNKIKEELIEVTYSFWDGKGHRNVLKVRKGDTIDQFLNKCREQVRRGSRGPRYCT
eukprot:6201720-Pleurochrysis_carterae.AAC.1